MNDEPRPGTVGSLDRRVERLEAQVSDLSTDFKLMKSEASHTRELMEQHFKTMEANLQIGLTEIKLLGSRFDAAVLQSTALMGDPAGTPAGRQIISRIDSLEKTREEDHADVEARVSVIEGRTAGVEKRIYMAIGATLLAVLAIQLIVPFLLNHIVP